MTATSNIHYNLTIWTSSTYSLGNRVFTGSVGTGNVYQCTTAGSSTSAPTGTGSGINNGGVAVWKWLSLYNYATLGDWWTAQSTPLTQPIIGLLWNNGTIADNFGIGLSGGTTKSSIINTVTVTCAPGESFIDYQISNPSTALNIASSHGVFFSSDPSFGFFSACNNEYLIVSNIQTINTRTDQYSGALLSGLSGLPNGVISATNCIFSAAGTMDASNYGGTTNFTNCLCLITGTNVSAITGIFAETTAIINCTVVATNTTSVAALQNAFGHAATITNSIIVGFGTALDASSSSATYTSTTNIVSNATLGTGTINDTGSQTNITASSLFVNAASDYRLLKTSVGFDTGTTISTTTDIFNTLRPQYAAYDIGCYEILYVAPAQWPIITWSE